MTLKYWRDHEPILLAFESAWRKNTPPAIDMCLAGVIVNERTSLVAELVMIEFEHRFQLGKVCDMDDYFATYPELVQDPDVRTELLRHEFRMRKNLGSPPTDPELKRRFPGDNTIVGLRNEIFSEPVASIESLVQPGAEIDSYLIEQRAGRGAFASVYSAVDTRLQRRVAIKFLTSSEIRHESRIRLRREAQAVGALRHPNIVPVYDTGIYREHDYIVTRFVDGVTLDRWSTTNPPGVRESVEIVSRLASALSHAHSAGIVHRDIKPANVMIENGVPQLVDFGLAYIGDSSQRLTLEGDLVGTPAYMSPEQAAGQGWQADPRSDIYALGALLYQMVFQKLPFEGTTTEIISQIIHREPAIERDSTKGINRDLQIIILKCLQKEPLHRYQSAAELEHDLSSYLDAKPIKARPVSLAGQLTRWSKRRPGVAALLVGVAALSIFGIGVASQLLFVSAQRDRAQLAEQETRGLLANSAADAGRLAMQKGKMSEAIRHFEQAIQQGYENRPELLLNLVEANFVLQNYDDAANRLRETIVETDDSQPLSALTLWRAELAFAGFPEFGDSEQLFERARDLNLSSADAEFVLGMLADTSIGAANNFRKAVELDPYHHRARRMLILLLLSLAKVGEADSEIGIARNLYPADNDFLLLDCLSQAVAGDLSAVEKNLNDSTLDSEAIQDWKQMCNSLFTAAHDTQSGTGNGQDTIQWLENLRRRFRNEFSPLLQERKMRLPPEIERAFVEFSSQLPNLLRHGELECTKALESLVEVHAESSLYLALGDLNLVSLGAVADETNGETELLEQAREAYRASLQFDGYFKQSDQAPWLGIFTTSMMLALIHQHDIEANMLEYTKASRQIQHESVSSFSRARALTLAAFAANDLDEAGRWITRWLQLDAPNKSSRIDVVWHRAILCQKRQDWLGAIKFYRGVLKLDPNNEAGQNALEAAIRNAETIIK